MRSGYGSREVLGGNLLVENNNVGQHLDGDLSYGVDALFDTEIKGSRGGVERYSFRVPHGERGYQNLHIYDSNMSAVDGAYPHLLALHRFAPEFGWEHKNYMRTVGRYLGGINLSLEAVLWDKGVVTPTGKYEYDRKNPRVLKSLREGAELAVELYKTMEVRPVRIDPPQVARYSLGHETSSCRAGEKADNSVVNSDFECHDIDNLFVNSAAVIPRGNLSFSQIPTCVVAAYAWRRIVENHFSRGA